MIQRDQHMISMDMLVPGFDPGTNGGFSGFSANGAPFDMGIRDMFVPSLRSDFGLILEWKKSTE
jgi:hypothetical protein